MKLISFRTLRSMCLDLVIFLIPLSLLFFSLPYILKLLAPFIAGVFLYFAANPLNKILKTREIPRSFCALISLFTITLAVLVIFRFVGEKIFMELYSLTENPPKIYTSAIDGAVRGIKTVANKFNIQDVSLLESFLPGFSSAIQEQITSIVSGISLFLIDFAKGIPSLFIAAFASVFTAFFLLRDSEKIIDFSCRFFGEKFCRGCFRLKDTFFSVAASYLKAQLILVGIVFAVLLSGFLLLKVKYAFLLAILTALVDAVPVFGTGTILLPMSIFNFLTGNTPLGWGILILYGVTLLVRQFCEPKILGKSLGIHPLLTVFSLYVGMKLFGIPGLVLGPFFAIFAKILIFPQ